VCPSCAVAVRPKPFCHHLALILGRCTPRLATSCVSSLSRYDSHRSPMQADPRAAAATVASVNPSCMRLFVSSHSKLHRIDVTYLLDIGKQVPSQSQISTLPSRRQTSHLGQLPKQHQPRMNTRCAVYLPQILTPNCLLILSLTRSQSCKCRFTLCQLLNSQQVY